VRGFSPPGILRERRGGGKLSRERVKLVGKTQRRTLLMASARAKERQTWQDDVSSPNRMPPSLMYWSAWKIDGGGSSRIEAGKRTTSSKQRTKKSRRGAGVESRF